MAETLYIIDGHSQIFRAYYAPGLKLTSPTGQPTGAVHVFCNMLLKFLADKQPGYLAMAIDGPAEKLRRRAEYAEYKITRKPAPDDFHPQAERIIEIVRAMGIPILAAEGYEADDIMATAAEKFASGKMDVMLVSRDKDLDQLVGEHVALYDPMKDEVINAKAIEDTKGYPPDKAVEVQTLAGDTTDNIPGVEGVGPKTAVKLINKYGSAEEAIRHADEQTPKLAEHLRAAKDTIDLSRRLVTLDRNVPIDLNLPDLKFEELSADVRPVLLQLGLSRVLERLDDLGVAGATELDVKTVAAESGHSTASDFKYTCVDTPKALAELVTKLAKVNRLSIDTETTAVQPMLAELVGVSLAWKPGEACYIPVKGPLGAKTLDVAAARKALGPVLADAKIAKVGQNIKYDMLVLDRAGMALAGDVFDTMVAAWVLDSSRPTYKLDALAAEYLNHHCIPIEEVIGRGRDQVTMDTVPVETVTPYAAEDADVAMRLADVLAGKLAEEKLDKLFGELEMPLLPVLFDMERSGVRVDPAVLKRMETKLSKQADALRERIIAEAGHDFNVDSTKQLAVVLFDELQLPVIKKGKTGPSTNSSVLEQLAAMNPIPDLVLDYRKLTKLLTTYLTALAGCIHPDTGRVHTCFSQTGTATGRLSSRNPNLQNIPIRTEQGRQIRSAFVAGNRSVLLSADYSQVELRVLAHFCEDPTLLAAFEADQDIHRIVAAEVFGVNAADVTPEQRGRAKTVNFGIIYGQTAFGLALTLRISRTEAGEFIKQYRKRFPRIDEFLTTCIEQARKTGYVETLFGRRRPILDIDARNPQRRAAAERLAINSVVQGSAADLIKQAMVNIHARILKETRPARMLLQIHDELLFEVPEKAVEAEQEMIVHEMTSAIALRVPQKVDVGVGANWMEAK